MKTMTCKQLGGACDKAFHGNSFDEVAAQAKMHGLEMFENGDMAHLDAINEMRELMKTPEAMKEWVDNKRKQFDALPDDK